MTMPDPQAEKLFREKADCWSKRFPRPDNIDVNRYQFHLAAAQRAQGHFTGAWATLEKACDTAAIDFGPDHPRAARARRKLEEARASSRAFLNHYQGDDRPNDCDADE